MPLGCNLIMDPYVICNITRDSNPGPWGKCRSAVPHERATCVHTRTCHIAAEKQHRCLCSCSGLSYSIEARSSAERRAQMSRQQSCFMFRLLLKSQKWFSYQERTASAKATALSYWLLWDVEWPSTLHISLSSHFSLLWYLRVRIHRHNITSR